ncbi:MAG: DUF434 domain-containing protein [Bacteroidales bacterium]|nr:DUF434 domain-containing protein [Bacteroidales bacterium]
MNIFDAIKNDDLESMVEANPSVVNTSAPLKPVETNNLIAPPTLSKSNTKRGSIPSDDINFSSAALEKMRTASRHICYLINEGYNLKMAYTFVGNHFALSERQRLAIARSIATTSQIKNRKSKEKTNISGDEFWIDGFNTIITLEVLCSNSLLFLNMDGTICDLASLRGRYRIIPETEKAVNLLFETLSDMKVSSVHILLDEPVSNSGRLKTLIAEITEKYPFVVDIQLIKAVDKALYGKDDVITSDSIILDNCKSWVNLVANCLIKSNVMALKVW